jgi:Tol biopolymer transport system component
VTLAALERGDRDVAAVTPVAASANGRASRRERVAWTMAALAGLVAIGFAVISRAHWAGGAASGEDPAGVTRLSVMPPAGLAINPESANLAISPNGRLVAFTVGVGVSSENQLWVRSLDTAIAKRIEAGDGASLPFWSPDSTRIGFFASRKIKTVPAAGGPADIVCDAPFGRGATWNAANTIVFAPDAAGPLYRVAAAGGTPIAATVLDESRHQTGHRFPVFLPDGDHFLYAALPRVDERPDIIAGSLSDPHLKTRVGMMESAPVYAAPGWLLFTRQGVLAAQAFDAAALRTTGDVVSLGDEPGVAPGTAAYDAGRRVSASSTGSLAFIPDPAVNTTVEWRDPSGKLTGTVSVRPGRYTTVAMSPDGTRAVLERSDGATAWSLWVVDLVRGGAVPLADDVVRAASPIWSPDSRQVAFEAVRGGELTLLDRTVGEASPARRIMRLDNSHPSSWFKDEILLSQIDPGTKWNVYRAAASGAGKPIAVVRGPAIEVGGVVSPDGHRIAFMSDESGNLDVFVQPYPEGGTKQQMSTGGVQKVWWERDGRHLLYLRRDQTLWRVATDVSSAAPRLSVPERIGEFPPALIAADLDPVGNRFLTLVPEHAGVSAVTIVQSWLAAIPSRR